MRIIAPMMILIMMASTLAGCTGGDPDGGGNDEIDMETIQEFIDEIQEPEWINDRGDGQNQWSISLSDNQWLEIQIAQIILQYHSDGENYYLTVGAVIASDEGYLVSEYSPRYGGNYSLCLDITSDLSCHYTPTDSDRTLHEWSIIYRIHNVSQTNYFFDQTNVTQDNTNVRNVNITMEISYVPNGMDEENRTNATVIIELYSEDAPNHVDSFLTHIENGNYNSAIFHRIINNFMIQGGDFEFGTGTGGYAGNWYGYCDGTAASSSDSCEMNRWTLPDEANNGLTHTPGALSMAKTSSPNTGGSQFFIVPSDSSPSHLNGVHTVFGYVTSGLDSITEISEVATGGNDRPIYEVTITNISINEL
ncbi:MAG: peptidylprolyl isomerase [Euryarchaeota archaeon]|jgi:peptidyl-prolyl cis-trans isomerase B (cyclophilin B)|nr:peptidylprolyl isomerase [Euryarchaeota archaeon]